MTTRRKQVLIIIGMIVLIALVIFLWWWFTMKQTTQEPPTNEPERIPVSLPTTGGEQEAQATVATSASIKTVARTFAERYGSFSTEAKFSNLRDLESIVTVKMQATIQALIDQPATSGEQQFSGVTTTVVNVRLSEVDESLGRATVVVSTQRQEVVGSSVNPRVYYQDLKLDLVDAGSGWKIDAASWL